MNIIIAGARGQVAVHLLPLLVEAGHTVRGMVRRPEYEAELRAVGAEPVRVDLEAEDDYTPHVEGADVAIFAAGAGQNSSVERKRTVDLGAAVKLVDAARRAGVQRFIMLSSIGAHDVTSLGTSRIPYLEAKKGADDHLLASGLPFVVVRPGFLTDEPATGRVELIKDFGRHLSLVAGERREIPRADVAAVIAACVEQDEALGHVFEAFSGPTPVNEAVAALGSPRP